MSTPVALLEMLDRDGHVRHVVKVVQWPLRVGRALDNDCVLDDPHTAAHHFEVASLAAPESPDLALQVQVGQTVNGLWVNGQALFAGQSIRPASSPVMLRAGDTLLRLRLPHSPLAPELALQRAPQALRGTPVLWLSVALLLGLEAFKTWLTSDPGTWQAALGSALLEQGTVLGVWCGGWSLLSKVITRRSHFDWHLRITVLAVLAWELVSVVPHALAFAGALPVLSSFAFVLEASVLAVAVAWHLRKVELRLARRRALIAWGVFLMGVGQQAWINLETLDQWGESLYLTHLYPPSWRLAPTRSLDEFMQGVAELTHDDDSDSP